MMKREYATKWKLRYMSKKRNNNAKFLLPNGVAEILQDYCKHNSHFKKPEVEYFKYLYIVHRITTHYNTYYLSHIIASGRDDESYSGCPLHVKTLAQMLGVNNGKACGMIQTLIDIGIIERKGGYTVGHTSYHYGLTSTTDEFTSITGLPEYSGIYSKIISRHTAGNDESSAIKLYREAIQNITIDIRPENEYYKYVATGNVEAKHLYSTSSSSLYPTYSYSSSLSSLPPLHSSPMVGENGNQALKPAMTGTSVILKNDKYEPCVLNYVSLHKTNTNIIALQAIVEGHWFVHRPVEKSRVYSNLTNLKREFRELLRYDGKPLIELDIRNSQPLIASILIQEYWTRKGRTIPADVIQYRQDCEAGTFYDYFMGLNNVAAENRREFKVQMFGEVFFSKVSKRNTKLKKQFMAKYPNVYTAICDIKGGIGSDTHNQFAILLQQKEASIIFDKVNIWLLKEGIPAFNIFDSILCLAEHREIVRERLFNAFAALNISPTINYKEY